MVWRVTPEPPQVSHGSSMIWPAPPHCGQGLLIEKNPFPLASRFDFRDGALPYVKVNVKMGETSDIRVLAEAAGKYYSATKEVKVTIGGCGG